MTFVYVRGDDYDWRPFPSKEESVKKKVLAQAVTAVLAFAAALGTANAATASYAVTVDGPDAIFLAGRTDVVIPPANEAWTTGTHLIRHGSPTPEEALETLPPFISVGAGDVIRVLDPAVGGVNFFNGFGPPYFGPSGNGSSGSNLTALDGISGYIGPQGPLTGVFLNDSIPGSGPAPANSISARADSGSISRRCRQPLGRSSTLATA
jgi:hypothetical protein